MAPQLQRPSAPETLSHQRPEAPETSRSRAPPPQYHTTTPQQSPKHNNSSATKKITQTDNAKQHNIPRPNHNRTPHHKTIEKDRDRERERRGQERAKRGGQRQRRADIERERDAKTSVKRVLYFTCVFDRVKGSGPLGIHGPEPLIRIEHR